MIKPAAAVAALTLASSSIGQSSSNPSSLGLLEVELPKFTRDLNIRITFKLTNNNGDGTVTYTFPVLDDLKVAMNVDGTQSTVTLGNKMIFFELIKRELNEGEGLSPYDANWLSDPKCTVITPRSTEELSKLVINDKEIVPQPSLIILSDEFLELSSPVQRAIISAVTEEQPPLKNWPKLGMNITPNGRLINPSIDPVSVLGLGLVALALLRRRRHYTKD